MKIYNPDYVKFTNPLENLNMKISRKGRLEQLQAYFYKVNKKVLSNSFYYYKINKQKR